MVKKYDGYLIDPTYCIADEIQLPDDLNLQKRVLHANVLAWSTFYLGLTSYWMIWDYEMFKKHEKISSRYVDGSVCTRGAVLIFRTAPGARIRSLSKEDYENIRNLTPITIIEDDGEPYNGYVLMGVSKTPTFEIVSD